MCVYIYMYMYMRVYIYTHTINRSMRGPLRQGAASRVLVVFGLCLLQWLYEKCYRSPNMMQIPAFHVISSHGVEDCHLASIPQLSSYPQRGRDHVKQP